MLEYADDLALQVAAETWREAVTKISDIYNMIKDWMAGMGIALAPNKTEASSSLQLSEG